MTVRAISYGGGVQSTALLVLAAQREIDFPLALFANTGDDSEHPATLRYVREVATPFAVDHGITLLEVHATRHGDPETLMQRLLRDQRSIGIPVRLGATGAPGNRTCTQDFKIKPIAKVLKQMGATAADPATLALGISLDEMSRMRSASGIPHQALAYPLIDRRMDRAACVALIERSGIPVPPRSACFFCPFNSPKRWRAMLRERPDLFAQTVKLERLLNERGQQIGRTDVWFTSALKPLDEAVQEDGQMDLFDGGSCDIGGYCAA